MNDAVILRDLKSAFMSVGKDIVVRPVEKVTLEIPDKLPFAEELKKARVDSDSWLPIDCLVTYAVWPMMDEEV